MLEGNRPIGLQVTMRDVTERCRIEQQLRHLSGAVEQSPASILITDTEGLIEYVNPRFTQVTGWTFEEVRGLNTRILKAADGQQEQYQAMWQALVDGREWKGELRNRRKDGEVVWESAHISPMRNPAGEITHYLAIYEDITERRNLQAQLQQAQKMESVGQLAAGVAHDFNNLLTVIQGHTSLLALDAHHGDEERDSLKQIADAAQRAANLTRQLLTFSRRHPLQRRAIDLNEILSNLVKMLARLLGEHIELQVIPSADLPPILADSGMIEQIVMNLAVNARDAMPDGGRLTLRLDTVNIAPGQAQAHPGMAAGPFVRLEVRDTGQGMDESVLAHLFEPFFTTKEIGRGTGLGLATVYGIVRQHDGFIIVDSTPGHGSTFHVHFPAASHVPLAPQPTPDTTHTPAPRGGNQTLLVVEDDPQLRTMVDRVLTRQGYRVLLAESGVRALKIWEAHRDQIDLLFTDLVMPDGMTGRELADRLFLEKPELPILYSSGYSVDLAAPQHRFEEGINFIAKPYSPNALVELVRNRLNRPSPATAPTGVIHSG